MNIRLIDDAKGAWRHFSTIALGLGTAIMTVWSTVPDDWKLLLPAGIVAKVTACILLWGLVGKFIKQPVDKAPLP